MMNFGFLNLVFIFLIKYINPCGITTHTEIAHRAASHYDYLLENTTSISQIITKYQSAFQAGNPYPDSFYPNLCKKGVFHQVSEDTHWVPFINATVNYIRSKYTKPYNEDALRLIVFLLGFTSHQIADVNWHSLDVDQGFLSAMGFVNFHGSFDQAHSVGDPGGDVVNQFELDTSYIADLGDWYIPYKDLYNIYFQYYGKEVVNEADIVECSTLLFLGRLGEQLAISLLYADYSTKSIFMINKLNDYFLGGLDDMATWTQKSWNKVLYMIENGSDKCQLNHNILYLECENTTSSLVKSLRQSKMIKKKEFKILDKFIINKKYAKTTYTGNGVTLSPSEDFQKVFKTKSKIENKEKLEMENTENKLNINYVTSNTSYFILNDYANLGWSLASADLNNDGADDLVTGAPVYSFTSAYQNGIVFIKLSTNGGLPLDNLNLETSADIIINAPDSTNNSTRFGHAVVVLDLNQDGFMDIVVSAPSYNLKNIKYQGQVYVYLGNNKLSYVEPAITLTCENYEYCNLGWTLSKGDADSDGVDDLLISTPYAAVNGPQSGLVGVLLSKKKKYPAKIAISDVDWIVSGKMIYEWFGFSVKAKLGLVAVGATQSRLCYNSDCEISTNDSQAVGRVYIYKYPSTTPVQVLQGENEFENFGYDFDLSVQLDNKNIIAVSSIKKTCELQKNKTGPSLTLHQGGVVQVFDITEINNPTVVTVFKTDRPYSDFGSKVKFYDVDNDKFEDLFISSSLRSDSLALLGETEEGIVYMFKGGSAFPIGNYTDECFITDLTPCPLNKASVVFKNRDKKTRFGNNIDFLRNGSKVQIAIAASRSDNLKSRLSGKIRIFNY